jgi:hypothetical protein
MSSKKQLMLSVAGAMAILAACGGGNGGQAQNQFGTQFAAAFNGGANFDPKDDPNLVITYMGKTGVDYTADPIDI